MSKQQTPQEYLAKVLKKWEKFCKGHRRFEQALIEILRENQQLKTEIEKLKGKTK